jgi:hypothetical protein
LEYLGLVFLLLLGGSQQCQAAREHR